MEWIKCDEKLPEIRDDSVIVYFSETGGVECVHIMEYFENITSGRDSDGNQLYTKWYLIQKVTHWMPLPEPPK